MKPEEARDLVTVGLQYIVTGNYLLQVAKKFGFKVRPVFSAKAVTPAVPEISRTEVIRMPFGKHRGKKLGEIPDSYLRWLHSLDTLSEPLRSAVAAEYESRRNDAADLEEDDIVREFALLPGPEQGSTDDPAAVADEKDNRDRRETFISANKRSHRKPVPLLDSNDVI